MNDLHGESETLPPMLRNLVVGTMCHCDEPDECDDHWEFFLVKDPSAVTASGHVGRGGHLNETEMRAIVALVHAQFGRTEGSDV